MEDQIVSGVIYGLHDGSGDIRYIGYTTKLPNNRLSQHRCTARKGRRTYKDTWIRSIGVDNVRMAILEYYTDIPFNCLQKKRNSMHKRSERKWV